MGDVNNGDDQNLVCPGVFIDNSISVVTNLLDYLEDTLGKDLEGVLDWMDKVCNRFEADFDLGQGMRSKKKRK
jgi:hypothetical protein